MPVIHVQRSQMPVHVEHANARVLFSPIPNLLAYALSVAPSVVSCLRKYTCGTGSFQSGFIEVQPVVLARNSY